MNNYSFKQKTQESYKHFVGHCEPECIIIVIGVLQDNVQNRMVNLQT